MADSEDLVAELAAAILDGTPIDWASAESGADGTQRPLVDRLRLLAEVADFHRRLPIPLAESVAATSAPQDWVERIETWGHLRVLERVGSGAFGEVFRAWDTRLDREVALKLLPRHSATGEARATSIIHEGRLLARVRHPNVVTIYGADRINERVGLWMEFVKGRTLEQVLRQGKVFSPAEVLDVGIELCHAVSAVHGAGLLHRDIKAQNVMLAEDGRVVLMDFGTGRELDDSSGTDLAGTPLYLAPELLRGEDATARSDLYSVGVLLYHLVTGSHPVQARDLRDLRLAHEQQTRTLLRDARPDTPAALARIIDRATEPRSDRRYATAGDLRAELESMAVPPRRWGWYAAAAVLLLAIAVALLVAPSPRLELHNIRQLTGADRLEVSPTFSPDGGALAYSTSLSGVVQVVVDDFATGGAPAPLSAVPALENQPRWSPDGSHILYITRDGVVVTPSKGGTPRLIVARAPVGLKNSAQGALNGISAAAWSPTSQHVAIADNSDRTLSILSLKDGRRQTIAKSRDVMHSCDWSPDARWIACTRGNWHTFAGPGWMLGNIGASAIVIVPAGGGEFKEVIDSRSMNQSPVWAADSRRLYFVSNRFGPFDVFSQRIGNDGKPRGAPVRETTGLDAFSIVFSGDRRRAAYTRTYWRNNLFKLPIPTGGVASAAAAEPVTTGSQLIEAMRVSRSGRWLLYDSNIKGGWDIFRMPISGGQSEQLTGEPYNEFAPDMSHDDKVIAYHSFGGGPSRELFIKSLDSGAVTQVTHSPFQEESAPVWFPDGSALAFFDQAPEGNLLRGAGMTRRGPDGVWRAERLMAGTWGVSLDPRGEFLATITPGGVETLSLDSGDRRPRRVYTPVRDERRPGGGAVQVADDGRTLYFKSLGPGSTKIWSVPVDGGEPTLLVDFGGRSSIRTNFAAGGGYFFFAIDDRRSNIWIADVREH